MPRITLIAAAALAALALGASTATAMPPDDAGRQDLRSPDTRDAAAGRGNTNAPDTISPQVFTDRQRTIVERFKDSPTYQQALRDAMLAKLAQPEPAGSDDGFQWRDAGIGAAGVLGLSLLAIAGAVAIYHRRQTVAGAAAATTR